MSVRWRLQQLPSGKTSTRWVVDVQFKHADGRIERVRQTPRVQSRVGAQRLEREIRRQLEGGAQVAPSAPPMVVVPTLTAFWKTFLATHVTVNNKPSEQATKTRIMKLHLLPRFGRLKIDEIGAAAIELYKADMLKGGYSPKPINNHTAVLRTLLMTAQRWEVIDRVPRIGQLRHRSPDVRFLSFDEAERLTSAAEMPWQTMVVVALHTGMRIGELTALRWEDLNFEAGRMRVRRSTWLGVIDLPKG